jgi:hypothetical protein
LPIFKFHYVILIAEFRECRARRNIVRAALNSMAYYINLHPPRAPNPMDEARTHGARPRKTLNRPEWEGRRTAHVYWGTLAGENHDPISNSSG